MTLIVAHRGAWDPSPENSLAAFERAIALGADAIEFDVRRGWDGQLVVHHDPLPEPPGPDRFPRLAEVLALARGRIAVDIELKEPWCTSEAIELIDAVGELERSLITSFDEHVVLDAKTILPALRAGLIVGGSSAADPLERVARCGADALVVEAGLAVPAVLAGAAQVGVDCLVWTVNHMAELDRLLAEPTVSGVITDRTALALERRRRLSARTAPAAPR